MIDSALLPGASQLGMFASVSLPLQGWQFDIPLKKKSIMNTSMLYALLFLSFSGIAVGDDPPSSKATAVEPATHSERYLVTIAEYRLQNPVATTLTAKDIVALIREQNSEPVETIRVSTVAETECMAQFGAAVTVTTGKIMNRDTATPIKETVNIGTLLRATASPHERGVRIEIAFESSRLSGEGTDDSAPDVIKKTISTTQILELGTPALIGATSAGDSSYVLVTVTTLP